MKIILTVEKVQHPSFWHRVWTKCGWDYRYKGKSYTAKFEYILAWLNRWITIDIITNKKNSKHHGTLCN